MKQSFYNFIVKVPNTKLFAIYNTKSGCLALLDKEEHGKLEKSVEKKDWDLDTWNNLVGAGFIVGKGFDELKEIEYNMIKDRFSKHSLSLTIAPTADCNFRCTYCYEKNNLQMAYMTDETVLSILEFIENEAKSIKFLNICWYGGEPLLAFGIIDRISRKVLALKESYGFEFNASMVTNGYLLDRKMILKLNELQVTNYQITLDGNRNTHDRRRFLKDKSGSFDKITQNLKEINDICPEISIRINVDKENSNQLSEFIEMLKYIDTHNKLYPYLGKVENYNNIYDEDMCFDDDEFYREQCSFATTYFNDGLRSIYPSQRTNFCCADSLSSFIIGHDAKLYKCWSDIGEEDRVIGVIKDSSIKYHGTNYYHDLLTFNPAKEKTCGSCKYLPVCMGGCPYNRVNGKMQCMKEKMDMESYIKDLCLDMIKEDL